ncbi:MAG: precorrin-2 C(20)-methyltransferase [Proteobacteria bacterium]|nr:precorrin-2 C(20)-methyltransferase [Pseudomonadota bacterium]
MKKKGIFYGVSLGVGHVMNVTVLALRVLNSVNYIAVPKSSSNKESEALLRMKKMPVQLNDKEILEILMPMQKKNLEDYWREGAKKVIEVLSKGKDVAFAGIGDLLQYGTFHYLERIVREEGFQTMYISGITSYQALSENLNMPLVQGSEKLAVLPDDDVKFEDISDFDTVVFLKKPDNMDLYKKMLKNYKLYLGVNLGNRGENLGEIDNLEEDLKNLPYFSLIIAKKGK